MQCTVTDQLGYIGMHWDALGCINWDTLGCIGIGPHWGTLGCIEMHWDALGCTGMESAADVLGCINKVYWHGVYRGTFRFELGCTEVH